VKTILEIAVDLAPHCGITPATSLVGSITQTDIDLLRCLTEAGQELASRFDWPQMRLPYTVTGAGNVPHNLPDDYSRMIRGHGVTVNGANVRGSTSDDEFNRLTPVLGTPRYYRTTPTTIEFWPYINTPTTAQLLYITKNWLTGNKSVPTADDDRPVFDDILLHKGALVRWRRMKGMEFSDWLDEYEGDLKRYSGFARSERTP
jgi:hypothetical protein